MRMDVFIIIVTPASHKIIGKIKKPSFFFLVAFLQSVIAEGLLSIIIFNYLVNA